MIARARTSATSASVRVRSGARKRGANGEAPAAGAQGVGAEHVEQAEVFEEVPGGGAQGRRHRLGLDPLADDEGEVDARRRVGRRHAEGAVAPARTEERIEVDLGGDDRRGQLEGLQHTVRDLPHDADGGAVDDDRRGPGRVEAVVGGALEARVGELQRVEHLPETVGGVVRVDGPVVLDGPAVAGAREHHGDVQRLVGQQRAVGRREEDVPVSNSATSPIPWMRLRATARSSPGRMRVRSTDSSARSGFAASTTRSTGAPARSRSTGATSGNVMASENPAPTSASATARRSRWRPRQATHLCTGRGTVRPMWSKPTRRATSSTTSASRSRSGRNVAVATATIVVADDALDAIPRGAARRGRRCRDRCRAPRSPWSCAPGCAPARSGRVLVDRGRRHLRARHLGEQLHGPFGVDRDAVGVDAPLEAGARLRPQLQALRAAGDSHAVEVRRLEQDLGGAVGDLRRGPPMIPAIA